MSITIAGYSQPNKTGSTPGNDAKVKWYTLDQAMKLNAKHPKKIFMDVFTDWCGWCKRYDAVTFANPVIAKYINENFYPVKFNAEQKEDINFKGKKYINQNPNGNRQPHELAVQFLEGKMSYPTVVFLNEKMDEITPVPGYMGPKDFEVLLSFFATDSYKSKKFDDYKGAFVGKVIE